MPLRLFLASLHHLFVIALKRENLKVIVQNLKLGHMLLVTCLSLPIQLGFPLLGADDGLALQPSLSSPALLDSQESLGL